MQEFGGASTHEKLQRVKSYIDAYQQALKNQIFRKIYIDAFAGTGYWTPKATKNQGRLGFIEFSQLAKGSARLALEVTPPFDRYVFIESKPRKFRALKDSLLADFPSLSDRIDFRNMDANAALNDICKSTDWTRNRAVAFLDPFGMQVRWETLAMLAETKSIDVWYLFPAHMGVARTVTHNPDIPERFAAALTRIYGTEDWRDYFYEEAEKTDLFSGVSSTRKRILDTQRIEAYTRRRLESIFPGGVAKRVGRLTREGRNMYLLFFAVGNPKPAARNLAFKLAADHILK